MSYLEGKLPIKGDAKISRYISSSLHGASKSDEKKQLNLMEMMEEVENHYEAEREKYQDFLDVEDSKRRREFMMSTTANKPPTYDIIDDADPMENHFDSVEPGECRVGEFRELEERKGLEDEEKLMANVKWHNSVNVIFTKYFADSTGRSIKMDKKMVSSYEVDEDDLEQCIECLISGRTRGEDYANVANCIELVLLPFCVYSTNTSNLLGRIVIKYSTNEDFIDAVFRVTGAKRFVDLFPDLHPTEIRDLYFKYLPAPRLMRSIVNFLDTHTF